MLQWSSPEWRFAMMQPSPRTKLTAHTSRLLDAFLRLRGTFAMLEPILFDREVIDRWGNGRRAHGLHLLVNTLLHSCVLDIAKIALDRDKRTPSLLQLELALRDPQLTSELREEFAIWHLAPTAGEDLAVIELLQIAEKREEAQRREQFDLFVAELRARWDQLRTSPQLISFGTMRDKLIAHDEVLHDGNSYKPLDVSTLGLKFGDLRSVISELQPLIHLTNLVYRNASFDFEMLDEQLAATSRDFWAGPDDPERLTSKGRLPAR
jgi:hypothetical protein